jgi:hypothetical protein
MTSLKDKVANALRLSPKSSPKSRPSFRSYVTDIDADSLSTGAASNEPELSDQLLDPGKGVRLRHHYPDDDQTSDEVRLMLIFCCHVLITDFIRLMWRPTHLIRI